MRFGWLSFSPGLIHARWVLGKLPSEEVPLLAQQALELGYDGRNMRRIAGLIGPGLSPNKGDLEPLMPGFLAEMGLGTAVSREEAGWLLARLIAEGISEAKIAPYEGARFIWREIALELWPNQEHRLRVFRDTACEYEDCESYSNNPARTRRKIEQQMIQDARVLLREIVAR